MTSTEVHRYKLPVLCDFSKLKLKSNMSILPLTEFLNVFVHIIKAIGHLYNGNLKR